MPDAPLAPQDLAAEEHVLGSSLLSPSALTVCAEHVGPSDFYRTSHGVLFEVMLTMHGRGDPVDQITVVDELAKLGKTAAVGGEARVYELAGIVPATSNAAHYARIVHEMATLRGLIRAGSDIARLGYERPGEIGDLVERAEGLVFELSQARSRRHEFVTASQMMTETVARLQELAAAGKTVIGVPTGYTEIDRMTSGLHPGNLIIIAARPSIGKALSLDANVLRPTGWCRNGDLKIGDAVIGADGLPDEVLAVSDEEGLDFYRVTFSDGATVDCCGDHHWLTRTRAERRRGESGNVRNTREILATLKRGDSPTAANHSVPFVKPVEFADGDSLPLDPYWMGLYLGDGDSGSSVRFTNPEPDIQGEFVERLPKADMALLTGICLRVKRKRRSMEQSESRKILSGLGLAGLGSHERFIPGVYLLASIEDRLALLQGLCDTDGYVTNPGRTSVEISTASPRLRDGILFLVGSLGGRSTCVSRPTHYVANGRRHEARESYRIILSFPDSATVPVRSQKHLMKWRGGPLIRGRERMISNVEAIGKQAGRCISVARGLYITDGFVVTHNSAMVLGMLANCTLRIDPPIPVALFTLEMSRWEVSQRLLSSEAAVDSTHIQTPMKLDGDDWERVLNASGRIANAPMFVEESAGITVTELRSKARRLKTKHPDLGMVAVDYIQLMGSGGRFESRQQEVSQISRALKVLAQELDVPVVALSQLSRDVEKRHDKRPILSDLRESGSIEQDADVVMMLYRESYYIPEDEDVYGIAEVNIAKHRNGPTGMRKLAWVDRYAKFADLAK